MNTMAENEKLSEVWQDVSALAESLQTKIKDAGSEFSCLKKQLEGAYEENMRLQATINLLKEKPCTKCEKLIDCTEMLKKKLKEREDTISVIGKLFVNHNPESYALASQMVNEVITSSVADNTIFDKSTVHADADISYKSVIPAPSPSSPERKVCDPPVKKESPIVVKKARNNKRKFLSISSMKKSKSSNGGDSVPNVPDSMYLDDDDFNETNLLNADPKLVTPKQADNTCDTVQNCTPPPNLLASPEILSSTSRCNRSSSGGDKSCSNLSPLAGFPKIRRSLDMDHGTKTNDTKAVERASPKEVKLKTPETAHLQPPCEKARNFEPMEVEIAKAIEPLPDIIASDKFSTKDANKEQPQKAMWNLKKSRELTNKKLKQTVLSTTIFEKKVDISTSSEYKGGSAPFSAKKPPDVNSDKFLCKENVDETFFEPPVTSTHNDYEVVPAPFSPAKATALAESTNKPRTPVKIEDSFDCLPSTSPKYKYKRDAVRKKSERLKLPGQDCAKCMDFYAGRKGEMTDSQFRKLLNKCSRHRDKFPIQVYTPPGLWNPVFDDTDEEVEGVR